MDAFKNVPVDAYIAITEGDRCVLQWRVLKGC